MAYKQVAGTSNEAFRDEWVTSSLSRLRALHEAPSLLDVGAGSSPYRAKALELGFTYRSHDFSAYVPEQSAPGLQSVTWDYAPHQYVCDILDIPQEASADLVLCTEVLEHVPDPVRAFQKMAELVRPGGQLVVSVPFLSLMHQPPFWFQSGLSPFWFEYWAAKTNLVVDELTVQGDYADLMSQEVSRLLAFKPHIKGLSRVGGNLAKKLRGRLSADVLQSGAFGTLFIGSLPQ